MQTKPVLSGPECGHRYKRLGTKWCPRARRAISVEVSAQLLQALRGGAYFIVIRLVQCLQTPL